MDDRLSRLESRVEGVEHALHSIEDRLGAVERSLPRAVDTAAAVSAGLDEGAWTPPVHRDQFLIGLSFVGRTLVALGGAYLLRALTDLAIVPPGAGITLGLLYALGWLVMADRASASEHFVSAGFHALVSSMVAYPLLWEATVRFRVLQPAGTAAALTLVTILALAVAVRRRQQTLAWIATLFALVTDVALVSVTGSLDPFAIAAIALGVVTLWVGYMFDWVLLRWPAALVADVLVIALAPRISNTSWGEAPLIVVGVQLLLVTGYLASIALRTLVRNRDVNAFEIVQAMAALGVGFGGAVYVANLTGSGVVTLASINLLFGGACYGVAFAFVARRQGTGRNFYFYTSLALTLVLVSSTLLLDAHALALTSAAAAVLAAWAAGRLGRVTLTLHAAAYLLTATVMSGLLLAAGYALAGPVTTIWPPFTTTSLVVAAAAAICWAMPMPSRADWGAYSRVPRLLIAGAVVWSACGWLIAVATPLLARGPGAGGDAGILATIRTTVLAGTALALAWAGRHERFHESTWLLYPALAAGGLKLLVEDLPRSQPATLFVALALYGCALIVAPRLASTEKRVG